MMFSASGTWDGKGSDKMMPIPAPTKEQLVSLPDGTEVINVIMPGSPLEMIIGNAPALMLDGWHMTAEIRQRLLDHPGELGVAMTVYVLPDNLVPDTAPTDFTEKEH